MKIRRRSLKKVIRIVVIIFIILLLVGGCYVGVLYYNNKQEQARIAAEKELVKEIKKHYGEVVFVNKNTGLFEKVDGVFKQIGTIASQEVVSLDECIINKDTKYFKIKDINYYVKYQDVSVGGELQKRNMRYKNYLLFNENVVTKENSSLYRDGKVIYTLKNSIDCPIVLKDDGGYYIEYFGELLFVTKDDVEKTYEVSNTAEEEANAIPVTVYHFIYLEGDTSCNEAICHSEKQIREHFNYLKTNDFFTMNTTELRLYLEGKLRAPKKSILVTIDDGARAWNFIPLLEEYQVNATLFLISGWYYTDQFPSSYLELASHTHNLHTPGVCSGGQGSPLKCYDREKLVADLIQSRTVLFDTEAFCFPFYEYNDYGISALKEAGFKMAFIGGYRKAARGVDLFKIPRIPLTGYTSLTQYANYIN